MTVTAKALASALLTYDLAVDAGPPTLATRVDAMRQVLEQFVAGIERPQLDPNWKPPEILQATSSGPWEDGLDGIVARPAPASGGNGPTMRYCGECGYLGDVPSTARDCCPDGGRAQRLAPEEATRKHAAFRAYLDAYGPAPASDGWGRASSVVGPEPIPMYSGDKHGVVPRSVEPPLYITTWNITAQGGGLK